MPMPIARWNPQRMVWETDQMDLFSGLWEPFSETFPTSGVMRLDGSLWPLPMSVHPTDEREFLLLPTTRATDGTKGCPNQRGSSGDLMLPSAVVNL